MDLVPMKFKRNRLVFFVLLGCLTICGLGAGANQDTIVQSDLDPDNLKSDRLNQKIVNARLFDGFLYFADPGKGVLKALPKQFPSNLNSHELGQDILGALMAGPPNSDLASTFPTDTKVIALFISEEGRAWVDLGIPDGRLKNMDTVSEILAIYSIVNSLALNISGVKQVKLLVNGSDVATLGGHVSLNYFYKPNMLIVK
jgi:spore germination protein GerM